MTFDGQCQHLQTLRRLRDLAVLFERLDLGRHEPDRIELRLFHGIQCQIEMSFMHRVKGAADDADSCHDAGFSFAHTYTQYIIHVFPLYFNDYNRITSTVRCIEIQLISWLSAGRSRASVLAALATMHSSWAVCASCHTWISALLFVASIYIEQKSQKNINEHLLILRTHVYFLFFLC